MAELTLTVQQIVLAGTVITAEAANVDGNQFLNDGRTWLKVINGSAASINVTANSQVLCDQGFDHDQVIAVAAGITKYIGPFETKRFNLNGYTHVTYSAVTTVTVAAIKI